MSVNACVILLIVGFVLLSQTTSARPRGSQQSGALNAPHPVGIICSANATRCWSEGSLLHSDGRCHPALSRGPCPEGQWWLLDRNGSAASARGKCSMLLCPPDTLTRECRTRMQHAAEACPRLANGDAQFAVHVDPTGHFRCGVFPGRVEALHAQIRCFSLADIRRSTGLSRPSFAVNPNGRQCARNDQGHCVDLVQDTQPIVTLESED